MTEGYGCFCIDWDMSGGGETKQGSYLDSVVLNRIRKCRDGFKGNTHLMSWHLSALAVQ